MILSLAPTSVFGAKDEVYEEVHKPKSFWFFSKPARDNASDQLSYAKKLKDENKLRAAARQYKRLVNYWPDAPEAPSAQFEYAQIMDGRGKLHDAFEGYKTLLKQYPNYMPYDKILQRMYKISIDVMNHRKGKFLFFSGFSSPTKAVPLFESIIELGPEWATSPEVQFLIGQAYDSERDYEMAIVGYTAAQYRYPLSPFAEKAAFARAYDFFLLSEESPNDGTRAEEAWAALNGFMNSYPLSDRIDEAKQYRITIYENRARAAYDQARFYDKTVHRPTSAIIAYRRFIQEFPHSRWTEQVENRIDQLQKATEHKADEKK